MNKVSTLIKSLRDAGFTQSEISRRTGIPQPRVSRWEAGNAPVGADDALALGALLREAQAAKAGGASNEVDAGRKALLAGEVEGHGIQGEVEHGSIIGREACNRTHRV